MSLRWPAAPAALLLLSCCVGTAGATSLVAVEYIVALEVSDQSGLTGEIPGSQRNALGFEWFGTVSGRRGDILRYDLQARISHDAEGPGDGGPGLEVHSAWLDYRVSLGRTFRVGHFSPAFGLEPDVDTHATLLQTQVGPDIGFKKDWGAAWMWLLGDGDATVALQTGSGAALDRRDRSYLASVRYTAPAGHGTTVALAGLVGRTLVAPDARTAPLPAYESNARSLWRLGADLQHDAGAVAILSELSLGASDGGGRGALLTRLELHPPTLPGVDLAVQARVFGDSDGGGSSTALAAGYRLDDRWKLSAGLVGETRSRQPNDLRFQTLLTYSRGVR